LQSQFLRRAQQAGQRLSGQDLGDQENGVRTGAQRFQQLIAFEDEVLPQDGQIYGGAYRPKIVQASLEKGRIGEHADTAGPATLVGTGDGNGVEVRPNDAG
jgi:hypothetical protein